MITCFIVVTYNTEKLLFNITIIERGRFLCIENRRWTHSWKRAFLPYQVEFEIIFARTTFFWTKKGSQILQHTSCCTEQVAKELPHSNSIAKSILFLDFERAQVDSSAVYPKDKRRFVLLLSDMYYDFLSVCVLCFGLALGLLVCVFWSMRIVWWIF